ncbi:MAG: PLP-dependent aminotransferase family protein [Kofleriaceae bacterium]
MDLHINLSKRGHLGDEIYRQLRAQIIDGRLPAGTRLPSSRELAERLEVSRNIVIAAFDRLVAEGFAEGRVGAGTYIAEVAARISRRAPNRQALVARAPWRVLTVDARPTVEAQYDFRLGSPDPTLFPWDAWRSLVARQLHAKRHRHFADSAGDPALRAAIARHIGASRSVVAGAEDIVITNGAQQALDLVARVLSEPGMTVAIEEPGYPDARIIFELAGAKVVGVPVDREGLDVTKLPPETRLVYVTPSHQFPLGVAMSLPRRTALLAWAEQHRAAIVEDDYDSEFRFDGRPLEPLQSLDRAGRVLYIGTFSKVLQPTLRIGFIVAPASVAPALVTAKRITDSYGPPELQRALAELIDDGAFARHLRKLIRVYRERRDTLVGLIEKHLPLDLWPAQAGLHVAGHFRDRKVDMVKLQRDALAANVAVHTFAPYYQGKPKSGLAFGYGVIDVKKMPEAIRRLAHLLSAR